MAEERLNPLTWLQGKFAQLVHTHTKSDITDLGTIPSKTSDLTNDGDGSTGHTNATFILSDDSRLTDSRTPTSHTHTTSDITNMPTIPSASSTTPSADSTSGSYGSGTDYARANHQHPKSTIYAEATHTHTYSNISNVSVVTVNVTYSDSTTGTIKLLQYTGS